MILEGLGLIFVENFGIIYLILIDASISNIVELILNFNKSMLAMSIQMIGCTPLDSTGLHTSSL